MADRERIARAFGENLRTRRQAVLMTQETLAHFADLHRTEIGLLERGRRVPRLDTILHLAAGLAIGPAELLHGIDVQLPEGMKMPLSTPTRSEQEANIEVGLLTVVLDLHPRHLTPAELIARARWPAAPAGGEEDALRRGLERLRRAELLREADGRIEPTVAALHFDRLPF